MRLKGRRRRRKRLKWLAINSEEVPKKGEMWDQRYFFLSCIPSMMNMWINMLWQELFNLLLCTAKSQQLPPHILIFNLNSSIPKKNTNMQEAQLKQLLQQTNKCNKQTKTVQKKFHKWICNSHCTILFSLFTHWNPPNPKYSQYGHHHHHHCHRCQCQWQRRWRWI